VTDIAKRIESEVRQLRSMKQHRDALASGELTEADIERMAVDRIRSGRTSGRRPRTAEVSAPAETETTLQYLGLYCRDAGVGLLDTDPWLISAWQDPETGVDDDPGDLPPRQYEVYVMKRDGKRYLCLALDWVRSR
jgi:hypothetical protein